MLTYSALSFNYTFSKEITRTSYGDGTLVAISYADINKKRNNLLVSERNSSKVDSIVVFQ